MSLIDKSISLISDKKPIRADLRITSKMMEAILQNSFVKKWLKDRTAAKVNTSDSEIIRFYIATALLQEQPNILEYESIQEKKVVG